MTQDQVLAELMARYDRLYPDASPFVRGDWHHKCRQVLEALDALGLMVRATR